MKIGAFETSIGEAWGCVEKAKLGRTISTGGSLPVNEDFRNLSLRSDAGYPVIYMTGLSQSHYNFLLNDFSYFQFTWTAETDIRCAFYPNPFSSATDGDGPKRWSDLLNAELITAEEYASLLSSAGPEYTLPFIRYEISVSQYRPSHHPCAHFHIGFHGEDRWAVRRLLSPKAFTLLIMKMYYGDAWKAFSDDTIAPYDNSFDKLLAATRAQCREVENEYFGEVDHALFFFN